MPDRETAHLIRGVVGRAAARATKDGGESQTVDIKLRYGIDRAGVEVLQPYGFASRPPAGGLVVVLAVGADQGDLVALPIATPGARLGNLAEGEAAMYVRDGSRVHVRADGSIDVKSSNKVTAKVEGATVEVDAGTVRGRIGAGRFVVTEGQVKMRFGEHYVVITEDGIFSDIPILIGPDPEPEA